MGQKFKYWQAMSAQRPVVHADVPQILRANRHFEDAGKLSYGDHGLSRVVQVVAKAIAEGRKIGLYADYDVDGTMSCVSWIWYLQAIGYSNFVHYIPCRFKEGYGLNIKAMEHLISDVGAELIITMDTGITANAEAAYCKERGVGFICTDHHVIQPGMMPDCVILNPKMHPDDRYKELCGCGVTFVLLRKLAEHFPAPADLWTDLLALTGMATICDVVPLNGVNHQLAKRGVAALSQTKRPVLRQLMDAADSKYQVDEKDVGFRLGPRINAVGRLQHADLVVKAFLDNKPAALIAYMDLCNEERKQIQRGIVEAARRQAQAYPDAPILFLGGDWHPGVVGIAASKIAEEFWRPVWLFQRGTAGADGASAVCRGSARSIKGFDVTAAMAAHSSFFKKFGGHAAAGGFSFAVECEQDLRAALSSYAQNLKQQSPKIWESVLSYDCELPLSLATLPLAETLDSLKPFGHGFEEPKFLIEAEVAQTRFFHDKETGLPKHTCLWIRSGASGLQKVMFFNEVHGELQNAKRVQVIASASRSRYQGEISLTLQGHDFSV